jgi:hypothetical protein
MRIRAVPSVGTLYWRTEVARCEYSEYPRAMPKTVRRYPVLAELDRRHAWLRPLLEAVVLRLIRTSLSAKARLLLATVRTVRTREYSTAGVLGGLLECPGRSHASLCY